VSASSSGKAGVGFTPRTPSRAEADLSDGEPLDCLDAVGQSVASRAALATLLQLLHTPNPSFKYGWLSIWFTLAALRDATLLPRDMVVDQDADLLPAQVRVEFHSRLQELNGHKREKRPRAAKRSTSILTLQRLGEAFFGISTEAEDEEEVEAVDVAKWDSGYDLEQGEILEKNEDEEAEWLMRVNISAAR